MRKSKTVVETQVQAETQAQVETQVQAETTNPSTVDKAQTDTQAVETQAQVETQVQAETTNSSTVDKAQTVVQADTQAQVQTQALVPAEETNASTVEDFTVCIAYGANGSSMPYEQQLKFAPNIPADKTELASNTARAISEAWRNVSDGYFKLLPTISAAFWNESWKSFVGVKSLAQMVMLITGCAQSTASELCKVASVMYDNHGNLLNGYEFFTYSDLIQLAKLDSVIRKAVRQKAEDEIKAGNKLTRVRLRNIISDACLQHIALAPKSFRDKIDKEERRIKDKTNESTGDQNAVKPDESTGDQKAVKPDESTGDQNAVKPDESTGDQKAVKPDESTGDQKAVKPDESTGDQKAVKPDESTGDPVSAVDNPFVEQISIGAALDDLFFISHDMAGLQDYTDERLVELFGDDVPQTVRINNAMKIIQALVQLWSGIDQIRSYESVNVTRLK